MFKKKSIGSVIAIAMLLIVATISIVGFNSWFNDYSSKTFTSVEVKSKTSSNTRIDQVLDDTLYFLNGDNNNLSINSIKFGDTICNITETEFISGMNIIDLQNCSRNVSENINDIVIITNKGISVKSIYLKDISITSQSYLNCSLDSITRNHGESYNFYNSSTVIFGKTCSFISRICNDGTFNGNNNFNLNNCSIENQDSIPNSFSFIDQMGVTLNSVITSNVIVPTEFNGPINIEISGDGSPELSINNGPWATSNQINLTDNLTIRLTSPTNILTSFYANLTLGNYSTLWNVSSIIGDLSKLGNYTSSNLDGARHVYYDGNYAYVASNYADSLTILDISNPSNILEIGSYSNITTLEGARDVYVLGNYAYIAATNANRLTILDISNPNLISELGTYTSANLTGIDEIIVKNNYAYVTSTSADSLTILDISNPNSISELGTYTSANLNSARNIVIKDNYAYIAAMGVNSLTILNVTDPNLITELDTYTSTNLTGIYDVFVDGNYAYVGSYSADRLTILDISNPNSINEIDSIYDSSIDGIYSVHVSENYVYTASVTSESLTVFKIN